MRKTKICLLSALCIIIFLNAVYCNDDQNRPNNKELMKAEKFPPCAACKIFTDSFKKGISKTSRGKFEGGDSAWEEDKLGSYSKSEVRLTEIQEGLCKEVERGEVQCHSLAEELETVIEDWWFKYQDEQPDIYTHICINHLKRCCPKDHFGPECKQCPGYPDSVCNNNGKCKGAGTRKGNGNCACDRGYTGETCSICSAGYYESYRDDTKLLCSHCHAACESTCRGPGPNSCDKCGRGWFMTESKGCQDINECIHGTESCPANTFCVNNDGSFSCLGCDKACNGCTGDGPDMCIKCANGYHKKDNLCIDSDILDRKSQENMARYATYLGLCVATCIILQRNVYAASVIGLFVGSYISISEYMIANSNIQDTTTNMNFLGPVN